MKILAIICRILLGLGFAFSGANGLFQFLRPDPKQMPTGLAGEFIHAMNASHYMQVVASLMLVAGLLLLVNRFVPLGLPLLGPILVNILIFHLVFAPATIVAGLVCTLLWAVVTARHWPAFRALLRPTF